MKSLCYWFHPCNIIAGNGAIHGGHALRVSVVEHFLKAEFEEFKFREQNLKQVQTISFDF